MKWGPEKKQKLPRNPWVGFWKMNIPLVSEHLQQREEGTVTSDTEGVSSPTAALVPFPTRAAAFPPLKAGNPSWPHLPAPSRPSSRHPSGLVLQAQPPGSIRSEPPQETPQSRLTGSLHLKMKFMPFCVFALLFSLLLINRELLETRDTLRADAAAADEHRGSRPLGLSQRLLALQHAAVRRGRTRHHLCSRDSSEREDLDTLLLSRQLLRQDLDVYCSSHDSSRPRTWVLAPPLALAP